MSSQDQKHPDPLRQALRGLPRERASDDFTQRQLERTRRSEVEPRWQPVWLRLAAAAALVLALSGGLYLREQSRETEARNQRQALQNRHLELQRELAELRERAENSPTLYVGTAREFDVVIDLGPWMDGPSIQPASYSDGRQ